MTNIELLKHSRDLLLLLHKALVDLAREKYERENGSVTSGQFLGILLENEEMSWLRKFSMLIVDIDELFAQKDGFSSEAVDVHLEKTRELVQMRIEDADLVRRYSNAVEASTLVSSKQAELIRLLE